MATLKTDFSDGDIFYSGAITDTDKLNGITTQINLKNKIQEIYTSTGFDSTSPAGGVNEESHEFTAITAANLININYLKIIINGSFYVSSRSSDTGRIELKVQSKYTGGAYSDSMGYKVIAESNNSGASYPRYTSVKTFIYYHTLSNDEKTNGIQIKIFSKSSEIGGTDAAGTFTNIQTIIQNNT